MKLGVGRLYGVMAASAASIFLGAVSVQATPVLDPAQYYTTYSGTVSGSVLNVSNDAHPFHGLPVFSDSLSGSSDHGFAGHTEWAASTENTYSPTPSLSVDASVTGRGSSALAQSSVAYWVTFDGPDNANLQVTLNSSGSVDYTGTATAYSILHFRERGSGVDILRKEASRSSGLMSFSGPDSFSVNTSLIYQIVLEISALVNDGGTASAMIDPTFVLPTGYRVVTSSFAVATTPIPAALPLFAAGLGGLGFVGWRRKTTSAI